MRCYGIASALLLLAGVSHAQDEPDLLSARALEKTFARIIQQNEPAVACILVSRSEGYQEFDQGSDKSSPGKLGSFNVKALLDNVRFLRLSADKQKQWRKHLDLADPDYVPRAFGSGVVIDASGLILTNYHVVEDATKLFVRLPGGKSSYADIHAADPRSDLAVLRLLSPGIQPLKTIPFGDADKMERGKFVLTLSNPFADGFRDGQPSASWGVLSNIRRRAVKAYKEEDVVKPFQFYGTLLQTDARLHNGCSGGALLNLSGEMVGLITSMAAIQGGETPGGFAVPVNGTMRRIIDVLRRGEEVEYAWLGIAPGERVNGRPGVPLTSVGPGSPAAVEGKLKKDDVLLAVNGQPVVEREDIFVAIGMNLAGSTVDLKYRRGPQERTVAVTLARLNVPGKRIVSSLGSRKFVRGLRVDYTSLIAQSPSRSGYTPEGVMISDVQPDSPAERANLRTGDVITHVQGTKVTSPRAFYEAEAARKGQAIELTIQNDVPIRVLLK